MAAATSLSSKTGLQPNPRDSIKRGLDQLDGTQTEQQTHSPSKSDSQDSDINDDTHCDRLPV
jgi:hypothetical protein